MGRSEEVIKMAVEEIKTILTTDRVVGTPIQIGDATIMPLVSVGFGFGGGGGSDANLEDASKGEKPGKSGTGEGAAAGGGVKPVALVIADGSGVRVEPVKAVGASLISSITDIVRTIVEERSGSETEKKAKKNQPDSTEG